MAFGAWMQISICSGPMLQANWIILHSAGLTPPHPTPSTPWFHPHMWRTIFIGRQRWHRQIGTVLGLIKTWTSKCCISTDNKNRAFSPDIWRPNMYSTVKKIEESHKFCKKVVSIERAKRPHEDKKIVSINLIYKSQVTACLVFFSVDRKFRQT